MGGGRKGMKDSIKSLMPLLFVKISCDRPPPPSPPPPPKVCWVKDDVMPWARHAKAISLASWGSEGAL